jgi:hypothetical protein
VVWDQFPDLKGFILHYLNTHASVDVNNDDVNTLTSMVLTIARACAIFGYYTSPRNVSALVAETTSLLDWKTDKDKGTFLTEADLGKPRSEIYDQVKINAIKLLEILANLRLRRRMFLTMAHFKDRKGRLIFDRLRGNLSAQEVRVRACVRACMCVCVYVHVCVRMPIVLISSLTHPLILAPTCLANKRGLVARRHHCCPAHLRGHRPA